MQLRQLLVLSLFCGIALTPLTAFSQVLAGVDGQIRAYGVDINGDANPSIDSTTEAAAILAAVQSQLGGVGSGNVGVINVPGFGSTNVTINASALEPRTDWGDAGSFAPTSPYTGGMSGDDFIQGATFSMFVPAGTYTVFANSDDGFSITFDGVTFTNRFGGGAGSELSPDEIRFEGPTGGSNTGAVFTLLEDTIIDVDAFFFERGGGDFFEIGIAAGNISGTGFPGTYQILNANNTLGILFGSQGLQIVPEPASIAIWTIAGAGLLGFGWCRCRRRAAR